MKRIVLLPMTVLAGFISFYGASFTGFNCAGLYSLLKDQSNNFKASIIAKTKKGDGMGTVYLSRFRLFTDDSANIILMDKQFYYDEQFLKSHYNKGVVADVKVCLLAQGQRWFYKYIEMDSLISSQFYTAEQNVVVSLIGEKKTGHYTRLILQANDPDFNYKAILNHPDSATYYGFKALE